MGNAIEIPGCPVAGPWVTLTETDWLTSGLKAVPLSITSCNRIMCGPEARANRNASTATCMVNPPSTKTATWPAFGEEGPVPGSVRLKFDTVKTTGTGLAFPMTALFTGSRMDRAGGDAARTSDALPPDTNIRPIVATSRAKIRRFMFRPTRLQFVPWRNRGVRRFLSSAEDQDGHDEDLQEEDSSVEDERQGRGRGRRDVEVRGRGDVRTQQRVIVVHESHREVMVSVRQRDEERGLDLDELLQHTPVQEQLEMALARGVRLSVRFDEGEVRDLERDVHAVAGPLEQFRGDDPDRRDASRRAEGRYDADGRAHVRTQSIPDVVHELQADRVRSGAER